MEFGTAPSICELTPVSATSTLPYFDSPTSVAESLFRADVLIVDGLDLDDEKDHLSDRAQADESRFNGSRIESGDSSDRECNSYSGDVAELDSAAERKPAKPEPVQPPGSEPYFDDFVEDLNDPKCVQRIYDFSLKQVRGMVEYNDEEDVIQEVFYRLTKWPIGKKYNSAAHYFSLLKITIRQAIAAYWKRRRSQRNDSRRRVFISQLEQDSTRSYEFEAQSDNVLSRLHVKELVKDVLEQVKTLDDAQRIMFELRFVKEKSHEEIAKTLNVSIRTSYRLETKLRELLQNRFYGQAKS